MAHSDKITGIYPDDIIIRKYSSEDRQALRRLCCNTAYFGEPCERFFPDRELLADLIMKYHTDYEPQHTWVAEYRGGVIGYLSACFDEARYNKIMVSNIVPTSAIQALLRGKIWNIKTYRMAVWSLKSFFSKEGKLINLDPKNFPIHIHQNIKRGFRGKGIGSKLLTALLEEVDREKLAGIKFRALRQEPRFPFFEKYGFIQFDCKRVPAWETWFEKAPLYFMEYGKNCYD